MQVVACYDLGREFVSIIFYSTFIYIFVSHLAWTVLTLFGSLAPSQQKMACLGLSRKLDKSVDFAQPQRKFKVFSSKACRNWALYGLLYSWELCIIALTRWQTKNTAGNIGHSTSHAPSLEQQLTNVLANALSLYVLSFS